MSFMKTGGKAILNKKTVDTLMELTAGVMNLDGTTTSSTGYSYTQKITVQPDDVIRVINQVNGTQAGFRYLTAYKGATANSALGVSNPTQAAIDYIVPEGVDGIVITQGNTARTIRRITGDAYSRVIQLNEDGALLVNNVWDGNLVEIANEEIRNTTAIPIPQKGFDVSNYAINSLRIDNTLDQSVNITFYQDDVSSNAQLLKDYTGQQIGFTVPANTKGIIVTADDFPVLNYLIKIKLYLKCTTSPTSGSIIIKVVGRR